MNRHNLAVTAKSVHKAEPLTKKAEQKTLCLATLSSDSKQVVWEFLCENRPDVAESIEKTIRNPSVQSLLNQYGAGICIERSYLPESVLSSLIFH